jgi:hypothetical protein
MDDQSRIRVLLTRIAEDLTTVDQDPTDTSSIQRMYGCTQVISLAIGMRNRAWECTDIIRVSLIMRDILYLMGNNLMPMNSEVKEWFLEGVGLLHQLTEAISESELTPRATASGAGPLEDRIQRFRATGADLVQRLGANVDEEDGQNDRPGYGFRVEISLPSAVVPPAPSEAKSAIGVFEEQLGKNLLNICQGLVALEHNPRDSSIAQSLYPSIDAIYQAARAMEFADIARVAQAMVQVCDRMGQGQLVLTSDTSDLLFMGIEVLTALTQIAIKGSDAQAEQILTEIDPDALIQSLNTLGIE